MVLRKKPKGLDPICISAIILNSLMLLATLSTLDWTDIKAGNMKGLAILFIAILCFGAPIPYSIQIMRLKRSHFLDGSKPGSSKKIVLGIEIGAIMLSSLIVGLKLIQTLYSVMNSLPEQAFNGWEQFKGFFYFASLFTTLIINLILIIKGIRLQRFINDSEAGSFLSNYED